MADDAMIEALKAIAHPLRWRILDALRDGERNVGEIEQATGIGQPGLSQQLGVLRKADLVTTRKDAKLVFYTCAPDRLEDLSAAIEALSGDVTPRAKKPDEPPMRTPAPGAANFARLS